MKAVASAFIEIKTTKFSKKVQVDPYLEDALCSSCGLHHGPYYCREMSCFRYVQIEFIPIVVNLKFNSCMFSIDTIVVHAGNGNTRRTHHLTITNH